ncbi:TIGR03943 family putative permease subunit [Microbacterium sp. ASV49]|uniref:TIGR03943 family protein n=1 Tax=Microbacterium candidum TaxID=3041922 RepID=A0ABT7MTQ6_9MICO|nr:TIGR03943 family protein [Microbacterium sp. ASV49]MDL9977830.1 TIGR03943 family protein [Microbacterium sp. ASV49]
MRRKSVVTRWLGAGLASVLGVVTLTLALTGRLGLYVNPASSWFAVGMAALLLVGAVLSCLLPLGAEEDHGHDHGDHDHDHDHEGIGVMALTGGAVASVVAVAVLVTPPATLSAQLAMSRDAGAPPLFAGSDTVSLAASGDTSHFGVGDWASVFATATNPDSFEGDPVTLIGFATPASNGGNFDLTRLIITHCVIDARPASVPIAATGKVPSTGTWVTVTGKVRTTSNGTLEIDATSVQPVPQPKDPYEY